MHNFLTVIFLLSLSGCYLESRNQAFKLSDFAEIQNHDSIPMAMGPNCGSNLCNYGVIKVTKTARKTYLFYDKNNNTCEVGFVPIPTLKGNLYIVTHLWKQCYFNGNDKYDTFHYIVMKYDGKSNEKWNLKYLSPAGLSSSSNENDSNKIKQVIDLAKYSDISLIYSDGLFGGHYLILDGNNAGNIKKFFSQLASTNLL